MATIMSRNIVDIRNQRFGRLTITGLNSVRYKDGRALWDAVCDCGNEVIVHGTSVRLGRKKSCGCIKREQLWKHGHAFGKLSPTYKSWVNMRTRCLNPKSIAFKSYGGRGIKVCHRWNEFKNFLADMGERPKGTSLDRIDVNGNYTPLNCRWISRKEQFANMRPRKCLSNYSDAELFTEIKRRSERG